MVVEVVVVMVITAALLVVVVVKLLEKVVVKVMTKMKVVVKVVDSINENDVMMTAAMQGLSKQVLTFTGFHVVHATAALQ